MIEGLGYAAMTFVVFSFCMKDIKALRIANSIGGLMFILYGIMIFSIPVILTNATIVAINLIQLYRIKKYEGKIARKFW